MKTISLWCHQGLGDQALLNGAVNKLSLDADVLLPCFEHNLPSVKSFYVNNPNVHIYPVNPGTTPGVPAHNQFKPGDEIVKTGFYGANFGPHVGVSFAENFYQQLEMNYEVRWTHNSLGDSAERFTQYDCYSANVVKRFVHDAPEAGLSITNLIQNKSIFRLIKTPHTILHYVRAIIEADERHFMDSGPYHVADSIVLKEGVNYLHKYAKYSMGAWTDYPTLNKWEKIT